MDLATNYANGFVADTGDWITVLHDRITSGHARVHALSGSHSPRRSHNDLGSRVRNRGSDLVRSIFLPRGPTVEWSEACIILRTLLEGIEAFRR